MNDKIRSSNVNCKYFFVKPVVKENVYKTAKKLMKLGRITEVAITEGDYGFMVKASPLNEKQIDPLSRKIMEIVGGSADNVSCLCKYVKIIT